MLREWLSRYSPQTVGEAVANVLSMMLPIPGSNWTTVERTREENRVRTAFALKLQAVALSGAFARWAAEEAETLHPQNAHARWQALLAFCEVPSHMRYCVPADSMVLLALAHSIAP